MDRPKSVIDKNAFEKLRRIAPAQIASLRSRSLKENRTLPYPDEIAFKLTNRCDLRCEHCYQWAPAGYHHNIEADELRSDLPIQTIAQVLASTAHIKSNLFLWGGEPLIYKHWDELTQLLQRDPRWTSICTNGSFISRRIDSLLTISEKLEVSISIDGFQDRHDGIRGNGAFNKAISGLRRLVAEKRLGNYKGEVTVNCVITSGMISGLYSFLDFLEYEGVDSVYVSLPWYLSDTSCQKMDGYFSEHFSWLSNLHNGSDVKGSWYSHSYGLHPEETTQLKDSIKKINTRSWEIKVRYNPDLSDEDIGNFISGSDRPAQNRTRCNAIHSRLDVFPNGDVVSCKFFPELVMGNLRDQSLEDIWRGGAFQKTRETIDSCGLMPVCAKCNLLYTRGA